MKALVLVALVAAVVSTPGRAAALPTQSVYDVSNPDGPDESDANDLGILLFDLDADLGRSCRYYMEWSDNVDTEGLSVDCYVDEAKAHGASSCVANSRQAIPTIVTNDRRFACTGFNTNGMISSVFLIVAAESAGTGRLDGIIQYTAANTVLYSLAAELYP